MAGLVLGYEALGLFILGIGGEGGQNHDALGQGGVKAFHGQDAVHAVHTEEGGGVTHGLGLGQDNGSGLVVDGQEHGVSAGGLGRGQLDGEVGGGVLGEGAFIDDLDALVCGLGHEGVTDALGVSVVIAVDHGHLGAGHVGAHIDGGAAALVGVGEAELEHIVLTGGHVGGGGGGSQGKDPLLIDLGRNGDGGAGGDRAYQNLHTPVHQAVIGVDGGLTVGHVVLKLELDLGAVHAAGGVDFVNGDLAAVHDGLAVDGSVTGDGAYAAEVKAAGLGGGIGAGLSGSLGGCSGSAAAAGHETHDHEDCHNKCKCFFHVVLLRT